VKLVEEDRVNLGKRLRTSVKPVLGRLALRLFPGRAKRVESNLAAADDRLLDRIIRFGLICRAPDDNRISELHRRMWAGDQGRNFARRYTDRFQAWFLSSHARIVDEVARVLGERPGVYRHVCEMGCGDGQVLHYLSTRLTAIEDFVGIDINEQVVAQNNETLGTARIRFVSGSADDWIATQGRPGTIFISNGGVLEYFSEVQVTRMLRRVASDLAPSLVALVEPVSDDHDLEMEPASRPYGTEWSFTHNHRHLLVQNGFKIRFYHETRTADIRWVLIVAETETGG
jgi:hypothetical protein